MKTKLCSDCKKNKLLKDFRIEIKSYKQKVYKYIRFRCRDCDNIWLRANYQKYKSKIKKSNKNYLFKNPWLKHYFAIIQRCRDPKSTGYKYYGGKGIKNFLTMADVHFLWVRDRAYKMEFPHIHRQNSTDDYTLKVCMFIEKKDHPKRKILQIDSHGETIRQFQSVSEAAKEMNTVISNISNVLTGRMGRAKGFRWRYA